MLAFIYGTLKRGHRANHLLEGQRFLREIRTVPGFKLYDCGTYPGLVRDGGPLAVAGELWEISEACLLRLDEYEGVPEGHYQRAEIELADGRRAHAYFYLRPTAHLPACPSPTHWPLENEPPAASH